MTTLWMETSQVSAGLMIPGIDATNFAIAAPAAGVEGGEGRTL